MAVCKVCGLPRELCVCGAMAKEAAKIKVYNVRRSYGKWVTIVEGIEKDAKELTKKLKSQLACGGTFKEGKIELQGNHKMRVKDLLIKAGFSPDQIEVE
ncbi:MAG: translation initiation factor [Candidatus Aenigmatarchaeota archaeon]